jgi:hypothetical protein
LGRFRKIAKATIGFVMSVRPFVRMEQLGYQWRDFYEILYLNHTVHSPTDAHLLKL